MSELRSETIRAHASYSPAGLAYRDSLGLSEAQLYWPHKPSKIDSRYTVAIDPHLSLELDGHINVHPTGVRLFDEYTPESLDKLESLVGSELTDVIEKTRQTGFIALTFTLSSANRYAIARLQAASPSTPELIRGLCVAMLQSEDPDRAIITPATKESESQEVQRWYGSFDIANQTQAA